ncbi:MAG: hypothetical protein R6U67_12365 [Sodalinema sp.]|uniref:hypothetical protein n=1 Tax=Sodalinema sp. TaxID=3080550 RepID=UPI000B3FC2C6|nr:MAG: hypothetical protein EYR95_08820 [Phormidium sp. SL48-SHIP]
MLTDHSHIVLDACCLLNISASGQFTSILESIPTQAVVTEVVRERELITLTNLQDQESQGKSNIIEFEKSIANELLLVVDFESEREEELFINYVAEMKDDGESATLAIGVNRGWAIATDDRKAISFAKTQSDSLKIFSSLDIIKNWADRRKVSQPQLREVLTAIRVQGRYIPHKNHPLLSWWEKSIQL